MTPHERRWAPAAHLSAIPGMLIGLGFVGPLLVLRLRSRPSEFVRGHAVAAVNFNVTVGVVTTATVVGLALLVEDPAPGEPQWGSAAVLSTLLLLGVYWFLFTVRGALAAVYGERYRYPLTLPVLRDR